ncbi:major facilitator superfamily transporter [Lophium mytilinum]|uniref:Major facilitator superfamily transporter n=1 Tax=Lophium mytilinum TaxID=390894 RepID=A0A6A6QGZ4_9PEZI|nr:major facilitator superfamily transporter [Lophium mytilinum]
MKLKPGGQESGAVTPVVQEGTKEATEESLDDPPMDHGLTAWLQVVASCIMCSATWGLTNTFGVFQAYYMNVLLPSSSASSISWIGSVQLFLAMGVGAPVGVALDAGYLRSLIVAGMVLEVLGMLLTAQCTKYWQLFLLQGVVVGFGMGMLGLTSQAVIPLWFKKRRALCSGIAAAGSNIAGVAYSIMLRHLFYSIGFPWAVRILAALLLASTAFCLAVMRLRDGPPKRPTKPFNLHHFRDLPYTIFTAGFVLMITAVYIPYFYISEYAILLGLADSFSFYLLAIANAGALVGRLIPNYIADRVGALNTLTPCTLLAALFALCLYATTTLGSLSAVSCLYGFVSGALTALSPAILANLTADPSQIGTRMGMAYTLAAFGGLVGSPIAGALKGKAVPGDKMEIVQRALLAGWTFCAVVLVIAAGIFIYVRSMKVGWGRGKV